METGKYIILFNPRTELYMSMSVEEYINTAMEEHSAICYADSEEDARLIAREYNGELLAANINGEWI